MYRILSMANHDEISKTQPVHPHQLSQKKLLMITLSF